ncbi:MAG: EAL domain-containing protein [Clostridia bacterium]|nr:EAL domain-containing protein [Clostridia bacterium]
MNPGNWFHLKRSAALLLALVMAAVFLSPVCACAENSRKIVRVGWYESPFNTMDELGRRSGYAYEYQQKVAAYTGWTYEYVEGSWPVLLEMLMDGRIDLMSDVSYTEERAEHMLYATLPMGAEEYYLYVAPDNTEITQDNFAALNGKKVGVNKGSVQADFFRQWAEVNGVEAELVELTGTEPENMNLLYRGAIDAYIALDAYMETKDALPLFNIGASDFYFAVSKARPELLPELNAAMDRIRQESRYYNQQLYNKFLRTTGANLYATAEEKAWIEGHGPIRVGYQDNYLAFCAKDEKTGELTGALNDYLAVAADCLENVHLDFTAEAFPTFAAALEAMEKGEIDCVFPANLTDYDGEVQGYFLTSALMRTDMSAVVREEDQRTFFKNERTTVAVNVGNPNYDMFLLDHFPEWRSIYFKDTPECLKAVTDGQADCILISNYRYNNIAALCEKYHLTTLSTGVEMDYCFAVNRKDIILYSILSRVTRVVPASTVNAALTYYFTEDAKLSFVDLLNQNAGVIVSAVGAVVMVILFMMWRGMEAKKKAAEDQRLITATETDGLTGLYSRNYFYEYAERMYREQPDKPMDAIVLNIERFHSVNALHGQSFGDQTLQVLGNGIMNFLKGREGIASREESDHFTIYCSHVEDCGGLLDSLQGVLDTLSPNTSIRLRMGVMPWQKDMEPAQLVEQARIACGLARGDYKGRLVVFDEKVREQETFERRLLNDLRRAVETPEFEVYYQPKFDIQTEPPVLKSAEALVRWRHPELGMIPPGSFIPLLERSGQISEVDRIVWSQAAKQVAAWKEKYGITVPVSVNLSRVDVMDPMLENTLDMLLEENGLACGDLKLEVTESACTENVNQVIDVIERLRKKGYEIEMDDFGSGYSSLNMLSAMPIDVLKMDRVFVSNMESEEKNLQLVQLILGIGRNLKIPVVAEGVETETQLRLLKQLGCALVQGYYFSRPLPAAEFETAFFQNAKSN